MSRVPAVIIAAVVGGTVLSACSVGGSNPSAVSSTATTTGASPASPLTGASGSSPASPHA
jgi:hypothetical protein